MNPPLKPLSLLLRTLPNGLHSELISRLLSHLLKGQYMAEQLVDLDGKRLGIGINDTRTELLFRIEGKRIVRQPPQPNAPSWDVRISGNLADFWLLASRKEDPDTLFFNRTLAIEGETEAGLYLKNLLDALEFDSQAHLDAVLGKRLGAMAGKLLSRSGIEAELKRQFG
jgi:predicted lipid carrier protein YhbT